MSKVKPQFDSIRSEWQLKVYLNEKSPYYDPGKKVNQRTFFSRFAGQREEPGDGFSRLKTIANGFRLDGHMDTACFYDNQDPNRKKKPILIIYPNGKEVWSAKASQVVSSFSTYGLDHDPADLFQ